MTIKRQGTTINIESNKITVSRVIKSRLNLFIVNVDGTIKDLIVRCDKVVELSNDLFEGFSRIYNNSIEDREAMEL